MSWVSLCCDLPADPATADAILSGPLAALLTGLAGAGELRAWYFERCPPHRARLHALDADRALLAARLTGLLTAVHRAVGAATPSVRAVHGGHVDLPASVATRCTAVSLAIVAATPVWQLRLRAAFDLTVATELVRRAAHRPGDPPRVPVGVGGRWSAVAAALRAGDGPAARWAACLSDLDSAPAGASRTPDLCGLLHNQLGLLPADSQRLHGALLRSARRSARPARTRPVGCPPADRRALDG